ncbi:hypothetical protein WN48_07269 [Eufriesea mexicana]|uniref:Uncharacterized protein n=1 Tax=Eufriesea mexicana TaxID=516756 RepID=A0A310SHY5_9HYME|nr:hypothetical protein WN48_07269 [Eufriesea mexicana]
MINSKFRHILIDESMLPDFDDLISIENKKEMIRTKKFLEIHGEEHVQLRRCRTSLHSSV